MPLHKSELVVLVATRRESALFLDVLRDWSALDLVADFILVHADSESGPPGAQCMTISGGRITSTSLQARLADHPRVSSAHVVCLSQVDDEFSSVGLERGGAVYREVRDALPSVDVTWLHAIAVARPAEWPSVAPDKVGWRGCHNVVLVPEDARAPTAGIDQIAASPVTSVRLTQQAAALCSAVGLWVVERRTPFNGEPDAGGGHLTALRTFTRHLDTEAVLLPLVESVIDVSDRYPLPTLDGRPVQRVEDEVGVASAMANGLLEQHADAVGARSRSLPEPPARRRIGFLQLFGLFFRFLGAAVTRAPKEFAQRMLADAQSKLASASQAVFLGSGPTTHVVSVNGIRGINEDGTLATPEEYDGQLKAFMVQVPGASSRISEHHDYSRLWKDFINTAFTLLDGGRRTTGLDAEQIGAGKAVITNPRRVVSPPSAAFEVAPEVRAVAKVEQVLPYDADAVQRTDDLLAEKADEQRERAAALGQARTDLAEWSQEYQRSYVGVIGVKLAHEMAELRREIRDYVSALKGVGSHSTLAPELYTAQQRLAKTLVLHALGFVLLAVLSLVIAVRDRLDWDVAVAFLVGLTLAWIGTGTFIFHRRQQALFAKLQDLEFQADLVAARSTNLGDALEDLRRLQRVYRQYLAWARALGSFIEAPWGFSDARSKARVDLGEGYPHNHRFGVAAPDETAIDDIANRLRPQLHSIGWLSRAWDTFRADIPEMGADQHLLEAEPDLIFTDRSVSGSSMLEQWSRAVLERRWTDGAGRIRQDIDVAVAADAAHQQRLLSRVRTTNRDGSVREESYDEFAEGLQDVDTASVTGRRFIRATFSSTPYTSDPWTVVEAITNHAGEGIPGSLVVTELSGGFEPLDLAFCHEPAASAEQAVTVESPHRPPQV